MKSSPLLSLLEDCRIHSGESLAQTLGISRTAVWKQIRRAKAEGVEIRTVRGQGYQLISALDLLASERILNALPEPLRAVVALDVLDAVDSTNAEVARRLTSGVEGVPVVVSDSQTAGRGRRGRQWVSPEGENLYLSLGLSIEGDFLPSMA